MKYKRFVEIKKNDRKNQAILMAIQLFFDKGITDVTMADIANESEIGVASLYRYFGTKKNLVIESAIYIWNDLNPLFSDIVNSKEYIEATGCDQISKLASIFVMLYNEHSIFLRFIHDFDSYVIHEHIMPDDLENYEKGIFNFYVYFNKAIEKGLKDQTIRSNFDSRVFYLTTTHTLMALTQKLCSPQIIKSDSDIIGGKEIQTLIDIFINYIRN